MRELRLKVICLEGYGRSTAEQDSPGPWLPSPCSFWALRPSLEKRPGDPALGGLGQQLYSRTRTSFRTLGCLPTCSPEGAPDLHSVKRRATGQLVNRTQKSWPR